MNVRVESPLLEILKRILFAVAIIVLLLLAWFAWAAGPEDAGKATANPAPAAATAPTATAPAATAAEPAAGAATANASDPEAAEQALARSFIATLQTLVAADRKEDLAKLVAYPLQVNGKTKAKNAAAFVKRYDAIMGKQVRQCLSEYKPETEELFSRNGQYMVGWGCIWFSPAEKGGMSIDAVNTTQP